LIWDGEWELPEAACQLQLGAFITKGTKVHEVATKNLLGRNGVEKAAEKAVQSWDSQAHTREAPLVWSLKTKDLDDVFRQIFEE
jgi:hypothetical protein